MPFLAVAATPLALLSAAPPRAGAPVLVIAAPWRDAGAIIAAAGGAVLGPQTAPLATIATSDRPDFAARLRRSGAFAVLDGTRLAAICGV